MYKSTDRCPDFLHDSQRSRLPDEQHKTDTIPDSTADINAAPTAEPAEGESWAEPVVLVKGESTRLPLPANFKGEIRWTVTNGMKTVGGSQKKYPLSDGETDGERTAGYASAEHLLKNRTRRNHYCS